MRFCVVLVALATLSPAFADTLTLRDGKTVQGTYMGGTSRQVRMAVGDRIESYDVREISSLQFETAQATQPVAAQPAPAPAATASAGEIPAGTQVTIRMIDSVDSEVNKIGQTFRASVEEPVVIDGKTVIPAGADVVTKLVELKETGRLSGGGQLTLDLDSITVNGKKVEVSSQSVTTAGRSRTGESAKVIGGTAALGAIIGAIAGGGKGAAIGAASGAGAGTAIQVLTAGKKVRIPSETRLTFTLQQPIRL